MARCLRCGAGAEWIEGRVRNEPDRVAEQRARIAELEGHVREYARQQELDVAKIVMQAERITELEAIVAKPPQTADGVPTYVGMEIWWLARSRRAFRKTIRAIHIDGKVNLARWTLWPMQGSFWVPLVRCYSTRAAAEAAKETR